MVRQLKARIQTLVRPNSHSPGPVDIVQTYREEIFKRQPPLEAPEQLGQL